MKKVFTLLLIIGAALLGGCASGPAFSEYKASIPNLDAEKGRIYFYRNSMLGAALQPDVRLNDKVVGSAQAKGAFYQDVTPGEYTVMTSTEVSRKLTLKIEKGQTRYVRFGVSMGFMVGHVYPELVEEEVGSKEILTCKFSGKTP